MKTVFSSKFEHIREYMQWLKTWHAMPVLPWIKAERLFAQGQYREAAKYYQDGLLASKHNRASSVMAFKLAQCYCRIGKYREGIESVSAAIAEDSQFRDAYVFLARLQLWLCHPKNALRTIQCAFDNFKPDAEIAALFLNAAIDSKSSPFVIGKAYKTAMAFMHRMNTVPMLALAFARHDFVRGKKEKGKAQIEALIKKNRVPYDAHIAMGEIFLKEGNTLAARKYLRKALSMSTQHPRIQALLAESYLVEGPGRSPEYALQLASNACCNSLWEQPRVMHLLAEAYSQCGQKAEAHLVASKARELDARDGKQLPVDDYEMAV